MRLWILMLSCTSPLIHDTMRLGSTGIAVLLRNSMLYAANVGDSRAVLASSGSAPPLLASWAPRWRSAPPRARRARLVAWWACSPTKTPFRADECERVESLRGPRPCSGPAGGAEGP